MVAVKLHDSINNVDKFLFWVYHMYLIDRPTKYKVTVHIFTRIYLDFVLNEYFSGGVDGNAQGKTFLIEVDVTVSRKYFF